MPCPREFGERSGDGTTPNPDCPWGALRPKARLVQDVLAGLAAKIVCPGWLFEYHAAPRPVLSVLLWAYPKWSVTFSLVEGTPPINSIFLFVYCSHRRHGLCIKETRKGASNAASHRPREPGTSSFSAGSRISDMMSYARLPGDHF